jgi:4-amino-4-deoxy-L-arabinose transferase-like glycosyltransferase
MMKTDGLKIALVIAILIGIAIRLFAVCIYEPEHGAVLQAAMAKGFLKSGEFVMEYGPVMDSDNNSPSLSCHFPPFYPFVIALHAGSPDFSLDVLKSVSLRLMLITAIALYFLTRKSFGLLSALFVTAVWILHVAMIDNSSKCLSENLQTLLIIVFLHLFHLSRETKWMLIPSGFALGLAYLSKSTIPFFPTIALVILGVVLLCRNNKKVIPWVLGGLISFLIVILPWGLRNYNAHGSFDTSPYIDSTLNAISINPFGFLYGILINFLPMLFVIIVPLALFMPETRKARLSDPFDALLLFFSIGAFVLSLIYTASFYVIERSFLPVNSIRYSLISFIPLMWLIVRYINWDTKSAIRRAQITVLIAFISAVSLLAWAGVTPDKPLINEHDIALSEKLVDIVRETQIAKPVQIGFTREINKNDFYYYLFALENRFGCDKSIRINYVDEPGSPDIIISIPSSEPASGYFEYNISDDDSILNLENRKRVIFIKNEYE